MPNMIKNSGTDGYALQVTTPARVAGLVEENEAGEATRLAPVRVYSFNDVLLVVDHERMDTPAVAKLVATTAEDTKSIYQGIDASIQIAGNGYQVQLPAAEAAGFQTGDMASAHPAPNLLVISKQDRDTARLAADIVTIRQQQVTDAEER